MPKRRSINKKRLLIFIFILLIVISIGVGCGVVASLVQNLPSWKPGDLVSEATSFVYDYKGNRVGKLHVNEDREPLDYKGISQNPNLVNAFIAIEDIRFFEHHGISVRDIIRAAYIDISHGGKSTQGASTITQQLVKNAILENREKTYKRKIQEALLAIQVERKYTKQEILTFYLNEIYFGHGAYGVQAGAQKYFGKNAKDLSLSECAILAGIVRNPKSYSPYLNEKNAKARRQVVLSNMLKYNLINQKQYDNANQEKFNLVGLKERQQVVYPWFFDYVVDQSETLLKARGFDVNDLYTGGLQIYTTLNPKIQSAAEKSFANAANFPDSKTSDQVEGAMIVMEPTGAVRAIMGGREYLTKRGYNRATQARRQPGSAIKPIAVYAPALEEGYSPASVIDDVPVSFGTNDNTYAPENYDGRYRGLISMRAAIKDSVNIPAVKILNEIGVNTGFNFAQKLGLTLDKNDKNLSLALGGISKGVTPLEMASAYSTFSYNGKRYTPYVITKITDRKGNILISNVPKIEQVMTPETAYLMTDMLRTVVNSGTGTRARLDNRSVAGKTGTTQLPDRPGMENIKGNKDSWFCGYTPELIAVVWEGYDKDTDKNNKPQYLYKAYGGQFPAQIFHDVLQTAFKEIPAKHFEKPDNIVYMSVDAKSGLLPSNYTPHNFIVNEIFAKKNLPTKSSNIWAPAIIDPETHFLATTACPQKKSVILIKRNITWTKRGPEDSNLDLPNKYCPLHPGDPATATNIGATPIIPPNTGEQPQDQQLPEPDQLPPDSNGTNNLSTHTNTGKNHNKPVTVENVTY